MPERSVLNETTRLGIEATAGTAVATTRLLQAVGIELGIEAEFDEFRAKGRKFHSVVTPTKEWTGGSLDGRATYDEMAYLLSMCMGTAVVSTIGTGTTRSWVWTMADTAPDAPKTATVEVGSAIAGAHRAAGVQITELGLSFGRGSGVEVSGSVMARRIETGITPTVGAVALEPVRPVLIDDVNVYMADTYAALPTYATSQLLRAISTEISIGDRFGPVWVLDSAQPSYVASIETEPDVTMSLVHGVDTVGLGLLGTMRAGSQKFLRVEATGEVIPGSVPVANYKMTIDFSGRVNDVGDFGDEDGYRTLDWGFRGVGSVDVGSAVKVTLQNGLAAL